MGKIIFLHPDLGIGGAERLVVDAALSLKQQGHDVKFLTNHHDPTHCFEETRDGSLPITVVGDWLPRHCLGKFYALCAYIRIIYAALYLIMFMAPKEKPDIIFCDQISIGIPLLKIISNNKFSIIFYCHFPDQLLSKPGGVLKKFYRAPLNWVEEYTTSKADVILVNSKFTARVFKSTFKNISATPDILYPSINTNFLDSIKVPEEIPEVNKSQTFVLSINRYERKKDIALALNAFSKLQKLIGDTIHLVVAGGYDERVVENLEYYEELVKLAEELGIASKIIFLKSPSDAKKMYLLKHCSAVVYTPQNEHFGIVPLEAMYMGKPVVACNSGGPTETIVNSINGYLCKPEADEFAPAILESIKSTEKLGEKGQEIFKTKFSFEAFSKQLNSIISNQMKRRSVSKDKSE